MGGTRRYWTPEAWKDRQSPLHIVVRGRSFGWNSLLIWYMTSEWLYRHEHSTTKDSQRGSLESNRWIQCYQTCFPTSFPHIEWRSEEFLVLKNVGDRTLDYGTFCRLHGALQHHFHGHWWRPYILRRSHRTARPETFGDRLNNSTWDKSCHLWRYRLCIHQDPICELSSWNSWSPHPSTRRTETTWWSL